MVLDVLITSIYCDQNPQSNLCSKIFQQRQLLSKSAETTAIQIHGVSCDQNHSAEKTAFQIRRVNCDHNPQSKLWSKSNQALPPLQNRSPVIFLGFFPVLRPCLFLGCMPIPGPGTGCMPIQYLRLPASPLGMYAHPEGPWIHSGFCRELYRRCREDPAAGLPAGLVKQTLNIYFRCLLFQFWFSCPPAPIIYFLPSYIPGLGDDLESCKPQPRGYQRHLVTREDTLQDSRSPPAITFISISFIPLHEVKNYNIVVLYLFLSYVHLWAVTNQYNPLSHVRGFRIVCSITHPL